MAELPDGTQVRRDETGVARSIRVPPTAPPDPSFAAETAMTPRQLADRFLQRAGDLFQLDDDNLAALSGLESTVPADKMQLRFKEEKQVPGAATVAYDQTVRGLPVWGSGVTVKVGTDGMRVLSSQNQLAYDVEIEGLPETGFLSDQVDVANLARLLGFTDPPEGLKINRSRQLIYRYEAAVRLDPALRLPHDQALQQAPPTLPLPAVPPSIIEGRHYVTTEVLFTLPISGWSTPLHWRAFIEPRTGAVLYLRALIASLRGCVFSGDPVLPGGTWASVDSPDAELNALRAFVDLAGLAAPTSPQSIRELKGNYVELRETSNPTVPAPTVTPPSEFVYEVRTSEFTAVNAYHHCDCLFRMLEEMGIDVRSYFDGTQFPVPVDHYALGNQVNAQAPGNATGNGSGGFLFGLARAGQPIGIAATARVVLHEFGHALLWDHVDNPNFGFAHSAGDSLAVILHDPGPQVADRFDSFPFITASGVNINRRHDRRVEQGWAWGGTFDDTQYGSEQILSTTLFRLYRAIGGDSTDMGVRRAAARYLAFLIIKSIGTLSFMTSDPEVYVDALMDADLSTTNFESRPGATLFKVVRWSFEQQGLYQRPGAPRPVAWKGRPPKVDVFVDDDRNGEYMPYLADAGQSRGIWNRHAADTGNEDQPPVPNVNNHLFARVRNRGWGAAGNVTVRLFTRDTATANLWPTGWHEVSNATTNLGSIAAGGQAVAGPLAWRPTTGENEVMVVVAANDDPSTVATLPGPVTSGILVPLDNNIGHRHWPAAIA
jgi:zinc metalloprotease ZmpB